MGLAGDAPALDNVSADDVDVAVDRAFDRCIAEHDVEIAVDRLPGFNDNRTNVRAAVIDARGSATANAGSQRSRTRMLMRSS